MKKDEVTVQELDPISIPARSCVTIEGFSLSSFEHSITIDAEAAGKLRLVADAGDRRGKIELMRKLDPNDGSDEQRYSGNYPLVCRKPTKVSVTCEVTPDKGKAKIHVIKAPVPSEHGGALILRVEDKYNIKDSANEHNDAVVTIVWAKLGKKEGSESQPFPECEY
ncbi:MAG: hypothetical protein QGH42_13545 [Kiritimatiellia bacterium]|nr:hypothetical protein [Kiritimatiellia bacterium]MDP7025249.1 hypothetical protein [Kiritimatiellia bacterium]